MFNDTSQFTVLQCLLACLAIINRISEFISSARRVLYIVVDKIVNVIKAIISDTTMSTRDVLIDPAAHF